MMKRIAAIVAALMLLCQTALANSWNVTTVLLRALNGTHDWDDYAALAEIEFSDETNQPIGVAVMESRYHNVMLISATAEDDKTQFIRHAVTKAVYQPEEAKAKYSFDTLESGYGFVLNVSDESYAFRLTADTYWLVSASAGDVFMYATADSTGYQALSESDVLSGATWTPPSGLISLENFNLKLFPRSVDEVVKLNKLYASTTRHLSKSASVIDRSAEGTMAVYSAPSEDAWRAANGKASVSLKESVNALGVVLSGEEYWTLLEYPVSQRTSRVGYVKQRLNMDWWDSSFASEPVMVGRDSYLTDDPVTTQYPQKALTMGEQVTLLALYDPYYAYVESEIDGKAFRGFMPLKDLMDNEDLIRDDIMAQITGEWLCYAGGSMGLDYRILQPDGTLLKRGSQAFYDPTENDTGFPTIDSYCEIVWEDEVNFTIASCHWIKDISQDPYLSAVNPMGNWYVTDYDPAAKRYWKETPYELVLFDWDSNCTTRLGLSLQGENALSLCYWEGGGGYVRIDNAQ